MLWPLRPREKLKWSDVADRRLEINTKERQYKSSDDASGATEPQRGLTPAADLGRVCHRQRKRTAGPTLHEMAAPDNHFRAVGQELQQEFVGNL